VKVAKVIFGPIIVALTLPTLLRLDLIYSRKKLPAHWTSTGMPLDVGLLSCIFSTLEVNFFRKIKP